MASEPKTVQVLVCVNKAFRKDMPSCGRRGGEALAAAIEDAVKASRLDVRVDRINCFGRCWDGPNARVIDGRFFTDMSVERVPEFIEHLEEHAAERPEPEEGDTPLLFPGG